MIYISKAALGNLVMTLEWQMLRNENKLHWQLLSIYMGFVLQHSYNSSTSTDYHHAHKSPDFKLKQCDKKVFTLQKKYLLYKEDCCQDSQR